MMQHVLRVILRSGKGPISLFLAFTICAILLIVNSIFPLTSNELLAKLAAAVALGFLAELLFLELEKKQKAEETNLGDSGILSFHRSLKGKAFDQLMSSPGHKKILNTWIFNYEALIPLLKDALNHDKTRIDITILSPECTHVATRSEELPNKDVKASITASKNDLAFFISNLPAEKKTRVKVFEFSSTPKITLYASDDDVFVGFFWPGFLAVHGPQFLLRGKHGGFSEIVWNYYDSLDTREITSELLGLSTTAV
jgi:hypothetical protein